MGKRELLLLVAFLAFGAVVYQVTAPPPDPNKESFSLSKFMGQVKAELHGENAETAVTRTATAEPPSGEGRLVIPEYRGTITIVGEERKDIAAELRAAVYGLDEAQAETRAKDLTLSLEEKGDDIETRIALPGDVRRRPRLELTLRVPAHLLVSLALRNGQADIRHAGRLHLDDARGKVTMSDVGEVDGAQVNGNLEIIRAHSVHLKLQRTTARLEEIAQELTLEAEHGELRIQQVHGQAKLTLQRLDCELDAFKGPVTIETDHVNLSVRNIVAPLTVKGEHTEVMATMAAAAPVTIETTDDQLDLRTPPGQGVTIDAHTKDGQIRTAAVEGAASDTERSSDDSVEKSDKNEKNEKNDKSDVEKVDKVDKERYSVEKNDAGKRRTREHMESLRRRSGDDREQRAQLKLHGGGPTLTLRNTRGDIVIR